MNFYSSLSLAELGPGKHRQAEVDHRGVKHIELAAELESKFGSKLPGFMQQLVEHSIIQFGQLLIIYSCQG